MGAGKPQLATTLKVIVLSYALAILPSYGDAVSDSSQKPLAARFRSIADLSAWAAKTYAGQYHKFVFERESKMVVVVIGTPTSGLPSGEVVVFQRALDGTYRVIVTRAMVYATVKVVEDVRGITFSTREPLLYIPWTGVLPDPDRVQ